MCLLVCECYLYEKCLFLFILSLIFKCFLFFSLVVKKEKGFCSYFFFMHLIDFYAVAAVALYLYAVVVIDVEILLFIDIL